MMCAGVCTCRPASASWPHGSPSQGHVQAYYASHACSNAPHAETQDTLSMYCFVCFIVVAPSATMAVHSCGPSTANSETMLSCAQRPSRRCQPAVTHLKLNLPCRLLLLAGVSQWELHQQPAPTLVLTQQATTSCRGGKHLQPMSAQNAATVWTTSKCLEHRRS